MGQISSAPVELIRVQRCGGAGWRGAAAEMQGWRADHEDAHFVADGGEDGRLLGTADFVDALGAKAAAGRPLISSSSATSMSSRGA